MPMPTATPAGNPTALRATGTDARDVLPDADGNISSKVYAQLAHKTPREIERTDANACELGIAGRVDANTAKQGISCDLSGENGIGRSGIRTHEKRICNPSRPAESTDAKPHDNNDLSADANVSTAIHAQNMHKTDPDFEAVAAAWPVLPAAIRAGIVAMVKAAGG